MKTNFNIFLRTSVLLLMILVGVSSWGQTAFTATYTFGSSGNVSSFTYNGTSYPGISMGAITKTGVTTSSSSNNFRATTWPVSASPDAGKYIGFTIAAQSGYKFTVTSITFGLGRSNSGTRTSQWKGSADSYASTLSSYSTVASGLTNTSGVLTNPDLNSSWTGNILNPGSSYANVTTTAGFRFYMYGAEASDGTAGLQGVITITGTYETVTSSYTVTFNSNGGSGSMTNQTASSATNLTSNSFSRVGYSFDHWNTASDNSGTNYSDGASYPFTSNVTLYAQWLINSYNVSYDGNGNTGGSVPGVQSGNYNSSVSLASNSGSLTKTGYTFNGWNSLANGLGTHYNEGVSFTIPASNTTLYAEWLTAEPTNHPTSFSATANSGTSITVNWSDNDGAQTASGFLVMANTTGTFTNPVDGVAQSDDSNLNDNVGVVNVNHGVQTYTWNNNVSGSTTYYFKIFPYNGSASQINYKTDGSVPTASVTTPTAAELTAGSLTDFGSQCIGATYGPNSFNLSGTNLSATDITIASLSGFTFSTTSGGTYSSSLTLSHAAGSYSQDIFVKFSPIAVQSYNGNIVISGGNANAINVAAAGSGINTNITISTGSASSVTSVSASCAADISDAGCQTISERGIVFGTSLNPTTADTKLTASGTTGSYSCNLSSLVASTTYHFRAYAITALGTTYGADQTFVTSVLSAPVSSDANNVKSKSFVANWASVSGANSYRLDVSKYSAFSTSTPANISGSFEGSTSFPSGWTGDGYVTSNATSAHDGTNYAGLNSNNKYIRTGLITNPQSVSFYYRSSSSSANCTVKLQTSPDGTTWTDQASFVTTGSGASTTYVISSTTLNLTGDYYIQWKMTARVGGSFYFDSYSIDYSSQIPSFVSGYENLTVNAQNQLVSGLEPNTNYYYRVRATDGNTSSVNSSNTSVLTYDVPGPSTNISFSNQGVNIIHIDWTNGGGDGRIVKINNTNSFTQPDDRTDYSSLCDVNWRNAGEQIVYDGTDNNVTIDCGSSGSLDVSNLWVAIFEYSSVNEAKAIVKIYNIGQLANENGDEGFLPVQIIYFNGKVVNNQIIIDWATASEINNNLFLLEKSNDGKNFEVLSQIKGAGNSNSLNKYQSTDINPNSGANYYRLTQLDFDGKNSNCGLIVIMNQEENNSTIWMDQNKNLTIEYNSNTQQISNLEVYNSLGQKVYQKTFEVNKDKQQYTFDLSGLKSGVYTIRFNGNNSYILRKILF